MHVAIVIQGRTMDTGLATCMQRVAGMQASYSIDVLPLTSVYMEYSHDPVCMIWNEWCRSCWFPSGAGLNFEANRFLAIACNDQHVV